MCVDDKRVITTLQYSTYRVKPTIVKGEPVHNERVPYLVSFKEPCSRISRDSLLWCNLCGGSIISEQRVLTAAHCFEGRNYYYNYHPEHLRVMAGNNHTSVVHSGDSVSTPEVQVRKITKVVLNADFHFPNNDIALVFLDLPWVYTEFVFNIVPAWRNSDYDDTCISAGYGKIGHEASATESEVLLMAPIHVLTRWRCSTLWQMDMGSFVCTDSVFGDVAKGDSGGPLACFDASSEYPGREVLVGVVSGKNFDKTSLFTRVSAFHHWVETDAAREVRTPAFALLMIITLIVIYPLFSIRDAYHQVHNLLVPLHNDIKKCATKL